MTHYSFVTLFDSLFLPQAVALYRSLERHCQQFTLWAITMDKESQEVLGRLKLHHLKIIPLEDIETERLLEVKQSRTRGEYCWTVTPFAPTAVFDSDPNVDCVTYLDADLWFTKSPSHLIDPFLAGEASVMITEHAYAPWRDLTAISGRFCVQFISYRRDGSSEVVEWWQDKCIEWCFARVEEGRFGDQKYLDDWPERFGRLIQIAAPNSACQGPWNCERFPYSEAVFFHFHGLRLAKRGRIALGASVIPAPTWENLYRPYLAALRNAISELEQSGHPPAAQAEVGNSIRLLGAKFKPYLKAARATLFPKL